MKKILLSGTVGLLLASSVYAADNNWYMGASIGQNKGDSEVTAGTASLDETDTAWKIYGGYNFNKYFALELFYADLGELSLKGNNGDTFSYKGTAYSFTANNASLTTEVESVGLNVLATYPVHKHFEPFAKLGLHRYDVESTVTASSISSSSVSDDGTDLLYGLGFKIPITESISVIAEWENYEFGDYGSSDFISAGLIYKF